MAALTVGAMSVENGGAYRLPLPYPCHSLRSLKGLNILKGGCSP